MSSIQLKVSKAGVSQAISPGQGRRGCPQVSDALGCSLEHEAAGERDGQQNLVTTRHTDGQVEPGARWGEARGTSTGLASDPSKAGFLKVIPFDYCFCAAGWREERDWWTASRQQAGHRLWMACGNLRYSVSSWDWRSSSGVRSWHGFPRLASEPQSCAVLSEQMKTCTRRDMSLHNGGNKAVHLPWL